MAFRSLMRGIDWWGTFWLIVVILFIYAVGTGGGR